MPRVLQIDSRDNVLIALEDLHRGETVMIGGEPCILPADVPCKHKFVTETRSVGDAVIMYGVLVGRASETIPRGGVVTVRNLRHDSQTFDATRHPHAWTPPDIAKWRQKIFLGYHRADGQVGTRNYWVVVPLVFCENRNVASLQQAFEEELGYGAPEKYRRQVAQLTRLYREGHTDPAHATMEQLAQTQETRKPLFENVDGIRFLMHQGGCGGTREDSKNLCGLIAGYLHHPNVAGATVLSLGCQHAQTALLMDELRKRDSHFSKPLVVVDQQSEGTEAELMDRAIRETFSGLVRANQCRREPASLSKLTIGLKCGGSDGFSGISANPAIGRVSDLLAALGGTSLLAEFPELCGVEQSLIDRCATQEAANKFVELMRDYAARAKAVRSGFEMNPSPGNIQDGLITDAMKSAGAARKSGTSPVTGVLDYPEYAVTPGLNLLCTPGNDVECVTAQVAAGANIVLFTTGLGTPTGNPVAPVVKLATNSALAARMPDIIDIDTGGIIDGTSTIDEMGEQILDRVLQIASGEVKTKAEMLGQNDFIPWKRGVSL
ncbi:MAG: altronate dehydratase family protein [Acidobacteria bacterium]|nr:altronate dehydratase family protein [Acidobacteriota bacterium]